MAIVEMLVRFGADVSPLDKAIDQAKKNLKSFKDVGKDLKDAGQALSMAITLPILGVVGASLAAAAQADESVKATLQSMENSVTSTMAHLGEAILPSIVLIFNALSPFLDLLNMAIDAFQMLPAPVQTVVVVLALMAAAIGPLLMLVGQLMIAYTQIVPVLFASTAAKTTAAGASIGLAAAEGTATTATYGLAGAVNTLLGPVGLLLSALTLIMAIWSVFDVGSIFGMGRGTTSPLINLGGNNSSLYSGPMTTWNSTTGEAITPNTTANVTGLTSLTPYGSSNERQLSQDEINRYVNWGVPAFGDGGVVDGPTLALIGEKGKREYVIPEDRMPGGSMTVVVPVAIDGREIARVTAPITMDMIRRKNTWTG